jgi:Gpi18-like mannosyltransferase
VETVPERLEPLPEPAEVTTQDAVPAAVRPRRSSRARIRRRWVASSTREKVLWIAVIYLATRGLLLLAAYLQGSFGHHNFLKQFANWDGLWYRELANKGYPSSPYRGQTTLGFFPLFPIAIWVLEPLILVFFNHNAIWGSTVAGVLISMVGGFVASVLVYRLAEGWWDEQSARRATILFILFPGSVVFSMVYSEGLLLPLTAGCMYALERRRWVLAGVLAGLGTAVQPSGVVLILMCLVAALVELRRQGWSPARAWHAFLAPALSVSGLAAFALYLWAHTGTPLANYEAQHHGWGEKTDFLALVHLTTTLANEVSFTHFNEPTINLNLVVGLIGAFLLLGMLVAMFAARRQIPAPAIVWTLGITFLAITSEYVPPNPRMLITAFPALMAVGHYVKGRWFRVLAWTNGILFVVLSTLTFVGYTLRP